MPDRTTAEICASVDRYLAEQAASYREPPRRRRRGGGRPQRASTRRKLSQHQFERHRARALEQAAIAPLRRVRLERGLTLDQAAKRALVSPRTFRRAEQDPESVSPPSWARIAASLKLPPAALLP